MATICDVWIYTINNAKTIMRRNILFLCSPRTSVSYMCCPNKIHLELALYSKRREKHISYPSRYYVFLVFFVLLLLCTMALSFKALTGGNSRGVQKQLADKRMENVWKCGIKLKMIRKMADGTPVRYIHIPSRYTVEFEEPLYKTNRLIKKVLKAWRLQKT
jgi:hypothetical protein